MLDILVTACLVPLVLLLLYIYGRAPMSWWASRGVPGPTPTPFIGNVASFNKHGGDEAFLRWNKQFGRCFGFYHLREPMLSVSDPDMLKEILVKKFSNFADKFTMIDRAVNHAFHDTMLPFARGAEWRRMRLIVTPAFSSAKLKGMEGNIAACCKRLSAILKEKAEKRRQKNEVI